MIETVVLMENGKYPFGEVRDRSRVVKVEDIRVFRNKDELKFHKQKFHAVFQSYDHSSIRNNSSIGKGGYSQNLNLVKLAKIYEQGLFLHFIFEYVPFSLKQYIQSRLCDQTELNRSSITEMNSKLFLKKVCYQLGVVVNLLVSKGVKTDLRYGLLGVDQEENLKLFVDPKCERLFSQVSHELSKSKAREDLREYYDSKVEEVLARIETEFRRLKRKDHYFPNFMIKGNKLEFCQDLHPEGSCDHSEISTSRHPSQTPNQDSHQDRSEVQMTSSVGSLKSTEESLLFKMKNPQAQSINSQQKKTNREKIEENIKKLQSLRKKSKQIQENVSENFLSNSLNAGQQSRVSHDPQKGNLNRAANHSLFNKKQRPKYEEESDWKDQQMETSLRQTHLPKGRSSRFSMNHLSQAADGKRSHSSKNHKSSFQFNPKRKESAYFHHNKSFEEGKEQNTGDRSFHQTTKSIRIELEQTVINNKERKNSYKVKILTCQEMEMDGENVEEFMFNAMNKNFDSPSTEQDTQSYSNSENYQNLSASYKQPSSDAQNNQFESENVSTQNFSAYCSKESNVQSKRIDGQINRNNKSQNAQEINEVHDRQNDRNSEAKIQKNSKDSTEVGRSRVKNDLVPRKLEQAWNEKEKNAQNGLRCSNRSRSCNSSHNAFCKGIQTEDKNQNLKSVYLESSPKKSGKGHKISQQESESPFTTEIYRQKEIRQKDIFDKYYEELGQKNKSSKVLKSQQLEQKIRTAKQKAENVLNKYMNSRKLTGKNSSSKGAL